MDPLSVAASIVALLQLSNKVLGYLHDVKTASREQVTCAKEISSLYSLLLSLRYHLEDGGTDAAWFTAVRTLTVDHGPLEQFKDEMLSLQETLLASSKVSGQLLWKFKKVDIDRILDRTQRLK